MSIIIYQHMIVSPVKGGISRMSVVYRQLLMKAGYEVFFLSTDRGDNTFLDGQLILDGDTFEKQHTSFLDIIKEYHVELMIYQDGISPKNNYILRWANECNLKIINEIHNTLRGMYGLDGHPRLSNIRPKWLRLIVNKCVNYYFVIKYGGLYREEFELCDKVVLLSDKFRSEITYFTHWNDFSKFTAITNPLTIEVPSVDIFKKKKIVLHVGLLSSQKRQDLLLNVWKIVEEKKNNWKLLILGDGPKRQQLEAQSRKLGLRNISFEGFQKPESYYEDASIFSLTSGYESFGLVLVESMAYGCVPMAFNSFETACDIIDNGINGKLIQPFDIEAYAQQMVWLMDNQEQRKEMAQKAIEKSKAFDIDAIGKLWYDLIAEIQGNTKKKY